MKKVNNKIKELAKKHNLPEIVIKNIYESQFRFMREKIQSMDIRNATEDSIEDMKTNFNIKYIGKWYTNWKIIKKLREINNKNGED